MAFSKSGSRWAPLSSTYPLTHSAFWLENRLWGDAPLGHHLVNIFLHSISSFLVWKILKALKVPLAGWAAAIFALHPVQVESVAWITELKNTLSGVCYFGAAISYLRFDRTRDKQAYALALALFAAGLMAKSAIASMPAALLIIFWWKRGKLAWETDIRPLIPFFAAGICAGLLTGWIEGYHLGPNGTGAHGEEFNFSLADRCLIAGRAAWFYLAKLAWPSNLSFSYARWTIDPRQFWQYLFPAAAAMGLLALWLMRGRHRGPLAAALFFGGTLFPTLGFLNVYVFRYSFVADHFQYLACLGPIVAACFGLNFLMEKLPRNQRVLEPMFCAGLLAALMILTWRQSQGYAGLETLWRTTVARSPGSWLAHDCLGVVDTKNGRYDEAISQFKQAIAIRPGGADLHYSLGMTLLKAGNKAEAMAEYEQAIKIQPRHFLAHYDLGTVLFQNGDKLAATREFQKAVELRPDYPEAQNNLGYVLLDQNRADEAITHLHEAARLNPRYAQAHYNLGRALLVKGQIDGAISQFQEMAEICAESGQFDEALRGAEQALRLASSQTNSEKVSAIREQIAHYRAGTPLPISTAR